MTPATAAHLARRAPDHPWHGMDAPGIHKAATQFSSFQEFIRAFMCGYRLIRKAADFQRVTEDLCLTMESQGVVHAEVLYSPGVYTQHLGVPLACLHDGIQAGLNHFPRLSVVLIVDTVINLGLSFMSDTLNAVKRDLRPWIRGFSVGGGDVATHPPDLVPLFRAATDAGLFCVAHVGEVDSPATMRAYLDHLPLIRIAHGCAAANQRDILQTLKSRPLPVDICLSSNLRTGVVPHLADHPIRQFDATHVPFSLSTDDPLYFNTTLFDEYQLAQQTLGCADEKLVELMAQSLHHSILTPGERARWIHILHKRFTST